MPASASQLDVEPVRSGARAAALFQHPVRQQILALARTPMSATEISAQLGLTRQSVNYHVRKLERAKFLTRAETRMRRNMVEQRYLATARAYVIAPELLGSLAPHANAVEDAASASALFALASRAQHDLTRVVSEAGAQSKRLATLSLTADVRFTSAAQRAEFTRALEQAITEIVARHTAPFTLDDSTPAPGRPYRLFLGCHPIPQEQSSPVSPDA